jgi:hypothetical protein
MDLRFEALAARALRTTTDFRPLLSQQRKSVFRWAIIESKSTEKVERINANLDALFVFWGNPRILLQIV